MANLPKPKVLPKVTYDPPPAGDSERRSLWSDAAGLSQQFGPYLNNTAQGIFDALNGAGDYLTGGIPQQPQPPKIAYPEPQGISGSVNVLPNVPRAGAGVDVPGGGMRVEMNAGQPTPPQGVAGANVVPQSALTNNRNNYAAAQAAGDTANMARLDAEWKRIAPMAQQFGVSKERIVNSYMQPSNPAAKSDFNSALAAAISDDVWANQATQAFGRPPTQQEWDEHWTAMNVGGRDPLEGHPQAVANIKATMQQMGQNNQQGVYNDLQQWLTKSGV